MEGYARGGSNTSSVLAFLSAWTTTLHAAGYQSGVYSSADSGVRDLAGQWGTGYTEPDDIWFAEWNGVHTVSSSFIPSGFWVARRLHQYSGGVNATYGGVTLNIDGDAVHGATAAAGGAMQASLPFPDGTFVQVSGTQDVYRIAGGAPLLVSDWSAFGGPQPYTVVSESQFAALNPVPADGTFVQTAPGAALRVAGGAALPIDNLALFPGASAGVAIDPWDVANAADPRAHLAVHPADGTIVEGLPSRTYWVFDNGLRRTVSATATATQVDDAALTTYPIVPCFVPSLRKLTIWQARGVLQAADCTLGTVKRTARPRPHRFLHVVRQFPGPHARRPPLTPVSLRLR